MLGSRGPFDLGNDFGPHEARPRELGVVAIRAGEAGRTSSPGVHGFPDRPHLVRAVPYDGRPVAVWDDSRGMFIGRTGGSEPRSDAGMTEGSPR